MASAVADPVTDLPGQESLFVEPTKADEAPRVTKAPEVPADPEAPYGYMRDPKTGEMRPKKAPGRGSGNGAKKAAPPPANRAANRPRTVTGEPLKPARSYAEKVGTLVDTLWMVTAATPVVQGTVAGVDMRAVTVKVKAQGALLKDQRPALVQGLGIMAENSAAVRRGIDWVESEEGPGWILPAMFAMMPFVAQTVALWKGTMEAAAPLAQRTQVEFAALAQQMGMVPQTAGEPEQTGVTGG